ncbi:hypothetical protein H5410_057679, partial [Solanum commersonii]
FGRVTLNATNAHAPQTYLDWDDKKTLWEELDKVVKGGILMVTYGQLQDVMMMYMRTLTLRISINEEFTFRLHELFKGDRGECNNYKFMSRENFTIQHKLVVMNCRRRIKMKRKMMMMMMRRRKRRRRKNKEEEEGGRG